jgi:hypothetical protein
VDNIKAAHDQQIRDMKTEMQAEIGNIIAEMQANHNQRFDNIQAEMDNQRAEIDNLNAARIPMFIANLLTDFVEKAMMEKAKRKSKSFSQKGGHVEITKGHQTPRIVDAALSITLEDLQAINVSSKYYDVVRSMGKVSISQVKLIRTILTLNTVHRRQECSST